MALPEAETTPPGDMETEVAPEVLQLSVELAPEEMLVGLAVKLAMTGSEGAAATVTVTCLVTEPAALVAVSVNVVVVPGDTVALPEEGTAPPPGTILTDEAPLTFQLKVEVPPAPMLVGLALKLLTTGSEAALTVMVAESLTVPAELVAVRV